MRRFSYRATHMRNDREESAPPDHVGPTPGAGSNRPPTAVRSVSDRAMATTTVVLVHWNQSRSCLASIEAFLGSSVPVSVLVVDNGSDPAHLERLRSGIASINDAIGADTAASADRVEVDLLETGRNLGFGPGANAGLARLMADPDSGPWFAIAPHDVDPAHDCIELMLRAAASHPMAGLMCADVGDDMVPVIDPYFGGMTIPADPMGDPAIGEQGRGRWEHVDYPHGTLMMASRDCLAETGLFDERYFSYCEEAELAIRAARAGFEIGLIRGARVTNTHIGSGVATVDYLQTRNTLLLVEENSSRYHAFIRLCIAVLQLLRGLRDQTDRPLIFDARARIVGMRDFLLRRFGPPPPDINH